MKPAAINLNIDELVLHGFPPGDHARIGQAIERELSRLIAERGVPQSLMEQNGSASLNVGPLHFAQGATPQTIGSGIAKAIMGGGKR
jgi:hypothetical protein